MGQVYTPNYLTEALKKFIDNLKPAQVPGFDELTPYSYNRATRRAEERWARLAAKKAARLAKLKAERKAAKRAR